MTNIWQQEKCESENENDVDMVKNYQHQCQMLDIEVELVDFILVYNYVIVAEDVTGDI